MMSSYILDANIFIRSKNEMPLDLWPSFWDKFRTLVNSENIYSCEKVKEELLKGNDELTEWILKNVKKDFFIQVDTEILEQYQKTITWAKNKDNYRLNAIRDFSDAADSFLIATAIARNLSLVTNEVSQPNSRKRVLIPDVCNALNVNCCNLNDVLRDMDIKI